MEIKSKIKPWLLYSIFLYVFAFTVSCSSKDEAQEIVDRSIEVHGGKNYDNVLISFDFRNRKYTAKRRKGEFTYTREFEDSLGSVKDVLNNEGFQRSINGQPVALSDEWKAKYASSVNGVIYFALLPYPLNDAAVNKKFLGEDSIKGAPYNKIEVTFSKEGGGEDFNDNFIYWIHKETSTVDYFAYDYETDGGGSRFREALNPRREGGILFLDYNNYEPLENAPLEEYHLLFEKDKLKEVSKINLENIRVEHL